MRFFGAVDSAEREADLEIQAIADTPSQHMKNKWKG